MTDAERIAAGLSEAQRRALLGSSWAERDGAWHPEGFYCAADRRVRYNLARAGLTTDYLRRSNLLTPLGLEVRTLLENSNAE